MTRASKLLERLHVFEKDNEEENETEEDEQDDEQEDDDEDEDEEDGDPNPFSKENRNPDGSMKTGNGVPINDKNKFKKKA